MLCECVWMCHRSTASSAQLKELHVEIPELLFENNSGHDVESLFWLAMFMFFSYGDASNPTKTEVQEANRSECRRFIFSDNIENVHPQPLGYHLSTAGLQETCSMVLQLVQTTDRSTLYFECTFVYTAFEE